MARMAIPDDLQQCIEFHGHLCPGLVIGYCAAHLGMNELGASRSGDEELIAIVENDSCAVDAVQVLTGCTFGKGNLFYRDHGKMVFTLARRDDGRSVRLCLRPGSRPEQDEELAEEERRRRRVEFMLQTPNDELFDIRRDALDELPSAARIHESVACEACGEMVMGPRIREQDGRDLCIPCAEQGA
jgi:formylmethanofuran dehydrogenase subunit E